MKKATSAKELSAMLVGAKNSKKCLVGNIILRRKAFELRNHTSRSERQEGDVHGQRLTLVKPPGWLRGYHLCDTPELFKTEAILSVTLCPPGPHCFILVINAELPFKDVHKRATQEHLQHFFGEKVWDHTIVVFTHKDHLSHKTIEDYIRGEGEPLQSLLDACGKRYHVIFDDGNDEKVKELFEKIDIMVEANSHYKTEGMRIQSVKEVQKEVYEKAENLRLQSQKQRGKLRELLAEAAPNLRILMLGWVFSGKSATGNSILSKEVFHSGDRTQKAFVQSGEVAGRQVVIVDTPGWWKHFPVTFITSLVKSEILEGVSLCSPSPNVILLAVPVDAAFTEEQRRVTEGNMRLLGQRVWRHVIVVFTFGDTLGDKTIQQHIESEGKPLHWLIEKCGNRYHVFNNASIDGAQVTELLEKMDEMIAGNSTFYHSAFADRDDAHPEEDRSDKSTENNSDEHTAKEITEKLTVKWDHKNLEKGHNLKGNRSMEIPANLSEDQRKSEEDDQFKDDAGSDLLNRWRGQLESEWSRREFSTEQALLRNINNPSFEATSEPDNEELLKSREKVAAWLKSQKHPSRSYAMSGYGTASATSQEQEEDNEHEKETL